MVRSSACSAASTLAKVGAISYCSFGTPAKYFTPFRSLAIAMNASADATPPPAYAMPPGA